MARAFTFLSSTESHHRKLGLAVDFLAFSGAGLQTAFPTASLPGSKSYAEYFFPGILLLTVLFTSIFSTISLIEDRHEGFLQSVMVAPLSRFSMVGGKVFGGSVLALFQGVLFLCLAPVAGISLTVFSFFQVVFAMFLVSFCLTTLGFVFAWRLDSVQGFHSIMNLVLFPMWLLSGSFFPVSGAPVWLRPVMYANPLTYGLGALKMALYGSALPPPGLPSFGICLLVVLSFGVLIYAVALISVGRRASIGS